MSNPIFTLDTIQDLTVFKTNPKLLYKLRLNTSEGNFYEAHQLYKTLHFRSISAQHFSEACDLIFNGIVFFYTMKSDNFYYCSDLSKVFIETLKKFESQEVDLVSEELLERIRVIHLALANGNEERNEFSCTILKWSASLFNSQKSKTTPTNMPNDATDNNLLTYQKTFGHVGIHQQFAVNFWHEQNYVQARYHFLHSTDGQQCALMLIECHLTYGYPSEFDLFLTQNVLQYLCLRNLKTARQFYDAYIKNHPQFISKPENLNLPLVTFLKFLFISIQHDQVKWFRAILEIYKPTLELDPSFGDYLERVGQYFFGIKPKQVEKESMFSNLFKMLTGPAENGNNSGMSNNNAGSSSGCGGSGRQIQVDNEEEFLEDNDLLD